MQDKGSLDKRLASVKSSFGAGIVFLEIIESFFSVVLFLLMVFLVVGDSLELQEKNNVRIQKIEMRVIGIIMNLNKGNMP
jgi:hypothetical protein